MTANSGAPTSEGTADGVRAADRAHVFHSWSAQELIDPLPSPGAGARTSGTTTATATSTSPVAARQRQHRPPAPEARRRDPGAGREALHLRAGLRHRRPQRGRPADRRARAGRPRTRCSSPTAARRPTRTPADGPAAHRPAQGARRVPLVPRRHRRRDRADRRPAPLGRRPGIPASCATGARTSTARRSTPRPRPRSASARWQHLRDTDHVRGCRDRRRDHPGDGGRHQRASWSRRPATSRASARSATGTGSS